MKHSHKELTLHSYFTDVIGTDYSDRRLMAHEVDPMLLGSLGVHQLYWGGLFGSRADLGLRAMRIYFNETKNKPVMRLLSYDEIVATAALIKVGFPKRVAAAMTLQELAFAIPADAPVIAPAGREIEDFQPIRVMLCDGSHWDVIVVRDLEMRDLQFVGDYAVWSETTNGLFDPDEAELTGGELQIVSVGEFCSPDPVKTH